MIEAYAFLAMFTIQILTLSVVHPAWFIRSLRAKLTSYPAECFAQLHPSVERSLTLYRVLNAVIAVLGLLLLGWLFSYMQRPDWTDGPVEALVSVYFAAQVVPLCLVAWLGVKFRQVLDHSLPERKRKAILERRRLFDFVSPVVVFVAVASYLLFAAFAIYIQRQPFPGFAGPLINIGGVTLLYALTAFSVYTTLYGRKSNPLETHADRRRTIGLGVKLSVFACIASVVFLSLNFTLVLLDLQRWEPFAQSVFLLMCALCCSMAMNAPLGSHERIAERELYSQ